MAFSVDPALIGSEYDVVGHPPVSADELMPKLRAKGFRGRFIVPLPEVRIV